MQTGVFRHPSVPPAAIADVARRDVVLFLDAALGTPFETKLVGEDHWWRASPFEVAEALSTYHPDLLGCFAAMLAGKEVRSGLCSFRVTPVPYLVDVQY
jgi:hypothetical protein